MILMLYNLIFDNRVWFRGVWECDWAGFLKCFFYLEMHQNNFYYFLKIIFDISISKWCKNIKKLNLKNKIN
jgi:hypothetical protein